MNLNGEFAILSRWEEREDMSGACLCELVNVLRGVGGDGLCSLWAVEFDFCKGKEVGIQAS